MNRKYFFVGMGMGAAACGAAVLLFKPSKKHKVKCAVGKALKTMGDMADSISDTMGW